MLQPHHQQRLRLLRSCRAHSHSACGTRYPARFRFVHARPAQRPTVPDERDHGERVALASRRRLKPSAHHRGVVFAHLGPPRSTRYLAKTRRAIAHEDALLTFFLLDDGSRVALAGGARASRRRADRRQTIADPGVTIAAVAHDAPRSWRRWRRAASRRPRHDGRWRGGAPQLSGPRRRASAGLSVSTERRRARTRRHSGQCAAMRWTA